MKTYLVLLLLMGLSLASCETTTQPGNTTTSGKGDRIFILDEGNFGHNNSHLDVQNWTKGTLSADIIDPLGDVGNDLQYINKKLYAVFDNSTKIVVINPDSVADRHTIMFPTASTPGRIIQINSTTAFVSDLYAPSMYVVDLTKDTVASTFSVSSGQSSILYYSGKIYATAQSFSGAYNMMVLNPSSKNVSSEKYIGENPMQVVTDSVHNSLLVATSGLYSPKKTPGKILWVNPTTLTITDSIVIDTNHFVNQIVMGSTKAYILYNDVVKTVDLASHTVTSEVLLAKSYFGGYFDAVDNLLYLGTAKDFQNNDVVDVFDMSTHSLKTTLSVGIAPAFFAPVR